MRFLLKTTFLAFVLLFSAQIQAQQKSIKFDKFTIEDGLSQSSVRDIIQDKFGIIWVATMDGLNSFNGYKFTVYKNETDNDNSIPNNYIHCLTEGPQGNIWFGTNRGIGVINPATFDVYRVNRKNFPELKGYIFTHLAFDKEGNLWAHSEKHGINIISLKDKKVETVRSIGGSTDVSCLYADAQRRIWVGTDGGKIYVSKAPYEAFALIKTNLLNGYNETSINEFYSNQGGEIIVSTDRGAYRVLEDNSLEPLSLHPVLYNVPINTSYYTASNKIWLGTLVDGLFLVDRSEENLKVLQYRQNAYDDRSLIDDNVTAIYEDDRGVVWIGTEKGLAKFDKNKQGFTTISLHNDPTKGLVDYNVWSFAEDEKKNIYIGTKKDLSIYRPANDHFYHVFRSRSAQNYLLSIYVENQNKIWLGYDDGLFVLTVQDKNYKSYNFQRVSFFPDSLGSESVVYQIIPADSVNLWLGSKEGITLMNKDTKEYTFFHSQSGSNSIGDGAVKVVYKDNDGKFWVVTTNEGLFSILSKRDGTHLFKKILIDDYNESKGQITSLLQTDNIGLWLGTYGNGLMYVNLETNEARSFTANDGLANNVIYGLLEDNSGNIWASTNSGLSKFNIETEMFTNYSIKDGLQSNEYNLKAYLKSSEGLLYFGGINGYNVFNPDEIRVDSEPPNVLITQIILAEKGTNQREIVGRNILRSKSLKFNYNQNDLSFEFIANDFSNPSKNKFKYILEGHEEEYTYLENENKVHFMNIPYGEYTFKLYGCNSDGVWSEVPTTVDIEITPPFWMTWWFRVIAILLLTLVGFVVYRRRIDKIRRQKVRLEIEVVKRTRQITLQSKKIEEQKEKVEIQKGKIEHQKELLEKEKAKVEQLLLNILPEGTAEELKNQGRAKARYYRNVTVMFTDFVGFSRKAEDIKPQELVQRLDSYFTKFDEIVEKFALEKIKTIGDSYMCAGGVPIRNKSNAIEVTLAALAIRHHMDEDEAKAKEEGREPWKIRIGINTGEVIAGVIGLKRFAYDIWGATVNQAQRMEQHGQPGTVNVSGNTYEHIAPYFECTYRGKIQTKHKGMLDMYYVKGVKPELSEGGLGLEPNAKFWKIVDLHLYSSINYMKAERHIMKILETELSPKLLYHSINHTIDVTQAVERLAIMEGITDEDLFLLKSAATYHDAGFIEKYDKNEEIGMRLAREILPKYGYTQEQIDIIDGLIKATEIPQSPNTHLQQIMCDADLDYLGRDDFHEIADLLRRELREHGKLNSDRMWDEIQIKFLDQHTYFTKSAIRLRQAKKEKHIQEIKDKLETFDYPD